MKAEIRGHSNMSDWNWFTFYLLPSLDVSWMRQYFEGKWYINIYVSFNFLFWSVSLSLGNDDEVRL